MPAPGEALLIKLWDTLADRAIGGLLRPWQIGREAKAHVEARRVEIVSIAAAEKEAEEIRSGTKSFAEAAYFLALPGYASDDTARREPTLDSPRSDSNAKLLTYCAATTVADSVSREVNVAKAVAKAEEEIQYDPTEPPGRNIERDWLFRWRDYAGDVSSDELQTLWGKILAGELKAPGKYSYRTLELLRNITVQEAKDIEVLFSFAIGDMVATNAPDTLDSAGLSLESRFVLQEIGVLQAVGALVSKNYHSAKPGRFLKVLECNGRGLIVTGRSNLQSFLLSGHVLTAVGRQLQTVGSFGYNEKYMREVGGAIKSQGFRVSIADLKKEGENVSWENGQEL